MKHESASALEDAMVNILQYRSAPLSHAIVRKELRLLSRTVRGIATKKETNLPVAITEREKEIL